MASGFEIGGGASEAKHEEVAEAALGSIEVVGVVQRSENIVRGDLAVEGGDEALKSYGADTGVNFLFFHPIEFY
jgi:hypothetical protein